MHVTVDIVDWMNYYGYFYRCKLKNFLRYVNLMLQKWTPQKYKKLKGRKVRASAWLGELWKKHLNLFAQSQAGIRP